MREEDPATSFHSTNIFPLLKLTILLEARVRLVAQYRDLIGVKVTVRFYLQGNSHSLLLLSSFLRGARNSQEMLPGASLAPPRSPTLSLIGPQQRSPRLSRLDVTEAAAFSDPNFPSSDRSVYRRTLSAPAFQKQGKEFWTSASSLPWAPGPRLQARCPRPQASR